MQSPPPQHPLLRINHNTLHVNNNTLKHVHQSVGLILGIVCGLIGFTNLYGFIFYAVFMLVTNIFISKIVLKRLNPYIQLHPSSPHNSDDGVVVTPFFPQSTTIFTGITAQVFSFLFIWTLVYNLMYVYN